MNSDVLIERLGRTSRVSGLLMALGTLVVAAALWVSYSQLRHLQAEVSSLASEASRLQTQHADLLAQNAELNQNAEKMRREIEGLREALAASRYAIEAFHQRDYSSAVSFYDQALRADPNNAHLLNLKAYSLFKLKRISEAIEVQKQSLHADPEYAWGYFDLARFECAAGSFEEARRAIDNAVKRRPGLRAVMAKDGEFQRVCGPALK